ncbi:hypothetical protein S40285_01920 [Stachybotrys chlorohalonatus IBT 40285]|uniref:DH domain-containing protein n=1 Tax=Stachybotrys chlorohalonatus (strain IBT 40285) TaxID=1283841 RepID=A0A084QQR1_STAC4|nr:hypothetical protein S40285_01920 [Stachybotrys chlorohalonata IBT 40285]
MGWDKDPGSGLPDGHLVHGEPYIRQGADLSQSQSQSQAQYPYTYPQQYYGNHQHHQLDNQPLQVQLPYRQLPGHPSHHPSTSVSPAPYFATHQVHGTATNAEYNSHDAFEHPVRPNNLHSSHEYVPTGDHMPTSTQRPSARSNGDGGTPPPRPINNRSAPSPVDGKPLISSTRITPTGKPNVRDLKKRFDQNNNVTPSISRGGTRSSSNSYSALRAGVPPHAGTNVPSTTSPQQYTRSKFVVEDPVSSNPQSFASRISKPRNSLSENPIASKSMTNLQHKPSPQAAPPSSPPNGPRSYGLLFGEIIPDQNHAPVAGHGIDGFKQRRVLDSGTHQHPTSHSRSFSDPDIEVASPSNWYRNGLRHDIDVPSQPRGSSKGHARSQSEVAQSKSSPSVPQQQFAEPSAFSSSSHIMAPSKLPVAVRKLSSPTNSNPSSTRSNSPTKSRRANANGKTSRAGTPVSRAKTPTQPSTGRRHAAHSSAAPSNNARLQAMVTSPTPAVSPPLRSSRPRQPVSMATTASSRLKAVDTTRSSQLPKHKTADKTGDATARRPKISVGPIDFEQRREHIRLAYSKSIRESQALEARHRAAERRRNDMEAAAKAKAAATEAATAAALTGLAVMPAAAKHLVAPEPTINGHDIAANVKTENTNASPAPQQPATEVVTEPVMETVRLSMADSIDGTLSASIQASTPPDAERANIQPNVQGQEDPTLGLPGSFPAFSPSLDAGERPRTSASANSETTEFDAEPQELPAVPAISPLDVPVGSATSSVQHVAPPTHPRVEYQYPFEEEEFSPKQPHSFNGAVEESQESLAALQDPGVSATESSNKSEEQKQPLLLDPGIGLGLEAVDVGSASVVIAFSPEEIEDEKLPFPRLEIQDESDCQSEANHAPDLCNDGDQTDACTEATDDRDFRDGYLPNGCIGDQISHRNSSCASSDVDALDTNVPDTLAVPSFTSPMQRVSQQSAWTDLTVESAECSDAAPSPGQGDESPTFGHATIYNSTSFRRESQHSATDTRYSSFSEPRIPNGSNRSSAHYGHYAGYAGSDLVSPASYLSLEASTNSPQVPVPIHDPPPIPASATSSVPASRRESSLFYDQSQYGSTLVDSGRESEDLMSPMESLQSVGSALLGTQDGSFGSLTPASGEAKSVSQDSDDVAKKERHRLLQRRNVIKELVDTEAVFVRDMNIVEEIYKGTAEACPRLDTKTVKLLFRNTNEIIDFHTGFLAQIKEAVSSVYIPKSGRSAPREESAVSDSTQGSAVNVSDDKDREVFLGTVFKLNMAQMKLAHEGFLRNSDHAAKKLIQIQQDAAVKVWLNECNEVAKDLTAAWDLDSLLIKPMQRITKYPTLIMTLLQHTPQDHPDREMLLSAKEVLETAIIDINKTKKNFELVGQIVGRKRKESDVRSGLARAFGKRVDKLQASNNRPVEDSVYAKLNEKFGDDYLRLQVVLRDVEFYTRQVTTYVRDFLQYLSSVELVMRLQPGSYPELESKWVQFNISIRDLEKVALEEHLAQVRKHVIEPFELVIKAYGNPSLVMKKRQKRRLDYERAEQLKRAGRSPDSKLKELVEQYEALNEALKRELPQLSVLTEKVGNICLANLVNIQAKWYAAWRDKMKTVLGDCPDIPDMKEVVSTFQRDFPYAQEQLASIGMLNPAYKGRASQSTTASGEDAVPRLRPRPLELDSRGRGLSINIDSSAPSLPTPDFARRSSGSFSLSPTTENKSMPSPHQYYYNYTETQTSAPSSGLAMSPEPAGSSRSVAGTIPTSTRPSTGRSYDSGALARQSTDSGVLNRRDSNTTYGSGYAAGDSRRFSGLFHSALPPTDGPEESIRSSRASSRERGAPADGYNVLWLAASLFEFNIATTKHEAGYPYLIYQAGEIFDVVAEKGELWLAKNQDDSKERVGWIWSKHFAKLADS